MENFEIKNICDIRVRYAETDKMGFVYNGEYLTYFEVARVALMRNSGMSYYDLEKAGYLLPLVESHVEYKSPAFFDDVLNIEAHLFFELKPVLKIRYRIFRSDVLIATGHTIHSYMNATSYRAVRPPKIFIDALRSASYQQINEKEQQ